MARPAGVKTFNVTFGPAETMGTGIPLQMVCSFTPATSAIWAVTGSPMIQYTEVATAPIGQQGSITLTEPDQDGFVDGVGAAVKGWTYLADIQYKASDGTTVAHLSRSFTHTQAQGDVDLDILVPVSTTAGTTVLIPDSWTTQIANLHGVPAGGTSGQTLAKTSGTDYAVGWTTPTAADATGSTKGVVALAGDLAGTADTPALASIITPVSGGSASQSTTYSVDAKGRITAIASTAIQIAESQVTNLTTDLAAKAALASPTFTGTPTLPTGTVGVTQTAGNSTTALATTAFVTTADNLKANLASPTFTGTPTLPTGTIGVTQTAGNSTTALATTAFVTTADNLKANIASPTFTGVPAAPTATAGTNTTQLATCAYVQTAIAGVGGNPLTTLGDVIYGGAAGVQTRLAGNTTATKQFLTQTGTGTVSAAPAWAALAESDITNLVSDLAAKAPLASPTFTGTPAAPTASAGTSTTQVATTAFVAAAVLAGQGAVVGVNTQTASYTTVLADSGKVVEMNSTSATTVTIPPNASVAYPVGAVLNVTNISTGAVTLTPGAAVTLQSPAGLRLTTQWASAALYQRATNVWVVSGYTVV